MLDWFAIHKLPQITVKTAELLTYSKVSAGIEDCRFNFQSIADNAGVIEQCGDLGLIVACNLFGIELIEGAAVGVALPEDCNPAQTSLRAIQQKKFE